MIADFNEKAKDHLEAASELLKQIDILRATLFYGDEIKYLRDGQVRKATVVRTFPWVIECVDKTSGLTVCPMYQDIVR
jgi:hypothetical protein